MPLIKKGGTFKSSVEDQANRAVEGREPSGTLSTPEGETRDVAPSSPAAIA